MSPAAAAGTVCRAGAQIALQQSAPIPETGLYLAIKSPRKCGEASLIGYRSETAQPLRSTFAARLRNPGSTPRHQLTLAHGTGHAKQTMMRSSARPRDRTAVDHQAHVMVLTVVCTVLRALLRLSLSLPLLCVHRSSTSSLPFARASAELARQIPEPCDLSTVWQLWHCFDE